MKDFDRYAFAGFMNSLWVVPPFFVNTKDMVGQELMDIDWSDKAQVKAAMAKAMEKMRAGYAEVPEIKSIIAGNFLDMVDRGHIKLDE